MWIETNTLATTVATDGKSGNLPVASFEYTFDHVADVDDDDNDDDVGEDDDDDNFGEVRDDDVSKDDDTDWEGSDGVAVETKIKSKYWLWRRNFRDVVVDTIYL